MPGDSNATRQRRHRLHTRGDHTECLATRCDGRALLDEVAAAHDEALIEHAIKQALDQAKHEQSPATRGDDAEVPTGLEDRGSRLWRGVLEWGKLTATQRVLLLELCRTVDLLDYLEELIAQRDPDTIRWATRERRQNVLTAKSTIYELRMSGVSGGSIVDPGLAAVDEQVTKAVPPDHRAPGAKGGQVVSLVDRVADRRA